MIKFSTFLIILYLVKFIPKNVSSQINDCECGKHYHDVDVDVDTEGRIIGGRVAEEKEFPWQTGFFNARGRFFCGGSIINDYYILTAAHCFKNVDPKSKEVEDTTKENITIAMGMRRLDQLEIANISKGPKLRYPEYILLHPSYDPFKFTNDIALIKLKEKLPNFNHNIVPICLPRNKKSSHYLDYANATVSGWGATQEDRGANKFLLTTNVKILSNEECSEKLNQFDFNGDIMMCAAAPGRDACQGDSGGALIFKVKQHKYQQIGIVSNGIGCADKRYPGIYTRLAMYSKWIKKNTKDASHCKL